MKSYWQIVRGLITIMVFVPLALAYSLNFHYPFVSFKVEGCLVDSNGRGIPGRSMKLYFGDRSFAMPATSDTNFSYRLTSVTDSSGKFWLRAVKPDLDQYYSDVSVSMASTAPPTTAFRSRRPLSPPAGTAFHRHRRSHPAPQG